MARAHAHAANQARRVAAQPVTADPRSAAEILAAIAAGIDAHAPDPVRPAPGAASADELLADMARTIDGGRP